MESRTTSSSSSSVSGTGTGTGIGTGTDKEEKMGKKSICVFLFSENTLVHKLGVFPLSLSDNDDDHPKGVVTLNQRRVSCCCEVVHTCRYPCHGHDKYDPGMGAINIRSSFYSPNWFYSGLTILGSTIYIFGPSIYPPDADKARVNYEIEHRYFNLTKSYKLDISSNCHDQWNWKEIPPMKVARQSPVAVVVDQEIYVFGGVCVNVDTTLHTWAEVFHTSTELWEPLPPPPQSVCDFFSKDGTSVEFNVAVLNQPKCILVGSSNYGSFCTYSVTQRCWNQYGKSDIIDVPFRRRHGYGFGQAAVFEQTLYWFVSYYYELVAYDVHNKLWLRTTVRGLSEFWCFGSSSSNIIQLVHVCDNLFCLLWTSLETLAPATFRIHCAKVRVSKVPIQGGLSAFIESCQSYTCDHDIDLKAGWLMDGIFAE